ncbi:hypothetical protein F5148DRAFT_1184748 [Russula earlei]|uniref:Uncharacterized protein n=1 Tax=Russula earlei TaxID=71964 RepID=A0ACC0UFH0_9AGAM|nr:hypothetical protein F5148DRAFT_1184748 [Russula earlei]
MARALRSVSQNYNWTLKRAHNDLHDVISSHMQTSSPPSPEIPSLDLSDLSWDSHRLWWKFQTEYEELREHLEHSFLIVLTWAVTATYLLTASARHFVRYPIRSVVYLYEEIVNKLALANPDIRRVSIRGFLLTLFRSAAYFMASLLWDISFHFSQSVDAKTITVDKTNAIPGPWFTGLPVLAHLSLGGTHMPGDTRLQADNTVDATTDRAPSPPAAPSANNLKDGIKTIHTLTGDTTTPLSRRKPRSSNGIEGSQKYAEISHRDRCCISDFSSRCSPHGIYADLTTHEITTHVNAARPSLKSRNPVSRHGKANVIVIPRLTDDTPTMGEASPLAHNPDYFAL